MKQKRTKGVGLNRMTEGKGWVFTGRVFGDWLELQTKRNGVAENLKYVRKTEYDDIKRYPERIPSYFAERLIQEGVLEG